MKEYLTPGVYLEETEAGGRGIVPVPTGITGFVGLTERGPAGGNPIPVCSYFEFENCFGGALPEERFGTYSFLAYAVLLYFANGGNRCYISRVLPEDARTAFCYLGDKQWKLEAKDPGDWGNQIEVRVALAGIDDYTIGIYCERRGLAEEYQRVSLSSHGADGILNKLSASALVNVTCNTAEQTTVCSLQYELKNGKGYKSIKLSGGSDGSLDFINADVFSGFRDSDKNAFGLESFSGDTQVSVMVFPGVTDPLIREKLIACCDCSGNIFAILDLPKDAKSLQVLREERESVDSPNVAMYHPWIKMLDSRNSVVAEVPPSGAIAGIFARCDQEKGIYKAPANESVGGCSGLVHQYEHGEESQINVFGVNLIIKIPQQGFCVWGARTCSIDSEWRFINVRRFYAFLRESIRTSLAWVAFEENDLKLWTRVKENVGVFLTEMWSHGALAGRSPQEAFFIKADRTTMTQNDIDNHLFVCQIGVAIARPSQFITFTISYKTADPDNGYML